ncbi:unnamed protein product, partial [Anisakis simplex]|uniref:Diphosphomevalonate decarboxylase n=1 Tax=Anisakis simplex TaxID=6269 RepID=A0A0M3J3C6_ANISI
KFQEVRRIIRKRSIKGNGDTQSDKRCFHKFEISSETNFPIEAGLASSAAGFAAIAFAFGHLYKLSNDLVLQIARLGSGSACRSLYEGFVHWKVGRSSDGSDCTCETIAPADKWNSLRALILVTSSKSKHIGSTKGMQRSVETSQLLKYRVEEIVPKRVTR